MLAWPLESPQLNWRAAALAQQATRVTIHIANTIQAEPGSKARVKIEIAPRSAMVPNSFVRINGLPHTAGLSEGHVIAPGSWSVALAALTNLEIILPAGSEGRSNFSVSLIDIEGNVLAETRAVLLVASAPITTIGSVRVLSATLSIAEQERLQALHAKGEQERARGNIYAARKFFERAVDAGFAQSAMSLAETYDPVELAKLKIVGLQPNTGVAQEWYRKARDLGVPDDQPPTSGPASMLV